MLNRSDPDPHGFVAFNPDGRRRGPTPADGSAVDLHVDCEAVDLQASRAVGLAMLAMEYALEKGFANQKGHLWGQIA